MPGPVTADPSPGSSRMFHGRLKIQLQGQCRHRPIETDHGSATFAANEVQGISKVHALTVDLQSLPHEIVLLKMQVANRQQTLKSRIPTQAPP